MGHCLLILTTQYQLKSHEFTPYMQFWWCCLFCFYPSRVPCSHTQAQTLTHTLDSGQGIVTEEGLAHPCVNSHHSVPVVTRTHARRRTHTRRQASVQIQACRGEKVGKKGRFSSKVRTRTNLAVSIRGAGSEGGCRGGNKEVKGQNIMENIRKLFKI